MTARDSSERRRDAWLAGGLWLALSSLFWLGRSRSFGAGDSAQHVLCALLWGVPHPPGYPLQTALGWLWSRPWSDPGAAVNGLSGVLHAAAAAMLFLLLRREGCRRPAALAAAGLMALSPLFWYYSLVAEVRPLNDLLAISAAYFSLEWARGGKERDLLVFALLFGLGLSHHPTFPLLVPAFAAWMSARRVSPRQAAAAALAALAALVAPYALLRLRLWHSAPAYNLFEVDGWRSLLALFLRTNLGGPLKMAAASAPSSPAGLARAAWAGQAATLAVSLWQNGGPAAVSLAALGAAALWKRDRRTALGWTLWFAVAASVPAALAGRQLAGFDPDYARAVVIRFHLLPMIALFALAGYGAERLASRARPTFIWALAAAVFLLPLALRPLCLAGENPLLDDVRGMVRDAGPRDMIVLASDDAVFGALDLELVRGETEGRIFLAPTVFSVPSYARALSRRHPDLRVPPPGPRGLTTDWEEWLRLNPGRAVLFEPSLLALALSRYPNSVPQGGLIRLSMKPVSADPAADARRFLEAPETKEITRWNLRSWTQEIYLLKTRRSMARWLASRLDAGRDKALLRAYQKLLIDLDPS